MLRRGPCLVLIFVIRHICFRILHWKGICVFISMPIDIVMYFYLYLHLYLYLYFASMMAEGAKYRRVFGPLGGEAAIPIQTNTASSSHHASITYHISRTIMSCYIISHCHDSWGHNVIYLSLHHTGSHLAKNQHHIALKSYCQIMCQCFDSSFF